MIYTSKTPRTIEHEGFWAVARAAWRPKSTLPMLSFVFSVTPKDGVTSHVVLPKPTKNPP